MTINLTPHPITIETRTIPPSGNVARVAATMTVVGDHDGVKLVRGALEIN